MAKISTLTDNFATQDNAKWTYSGPTVSGGQLNIVPTLSYPDLFSASTYDLTSSEFVLQVVQNAGSGTGATSLTLKIYVDSSNSISFSIPGGTSSTMTMRETVAGVDSDTTTAYTTSGMQWFKIRESGGTIYWETSADGTSWTTQRSKTTTLTLTAVHAEVYCGFWQATPTPGTVLIDNVGLPPTGASSTAVTVGRTAAGAVGVSRSSTSTALALGQTADGAVNVLGLSRSSVSTAVTLGRTAAGSVSNAKIATTLVDDFATQDNAKWTYSGPTVSGGQLRIVPTASYPNVYSVASHDLTSSQFLVQLVQNTPVGTGATEVYISVRLGNGDGINFVIEGGTSSNMTMRETVSGIDSDTTATYTSDIQWFRIRESSGTVYWETSTNGASWTTQRSKSTTLTLTAIHAELMCGFWQATPTPGTAIFDNVGLPPTGVLSGSASSTVTVGGTATGVVSLSSTSTSTGVAFSRTADGSVAAPGGSASSTITFTRTAAGAVAPASVAESWKCGHIALSSGPPSVPGGGLASSTINVGRTSAGILGVNRSSTSTAATFTRTAAGSVTSSRPFFAAADWLWTKIPASPALDVNSGNIVTYLGATSAGINHGAAVFEYARTIVFPSEITAATPRFNVSMVNRTGGPAGNNWGPDPIVGDLVPIPANTIIPHKNGQTPGTYSSLGGGTPDGHVGILDDRFNNKAYGIWQATHPNSSTWGGSWGGSMPLNGSGVGGGGATASGMHLAAGCITVAEMQAGVIPHAIVFGTDMCKPTTFRTPAITTDGDNLAGVPANSTIEQGTRVQLNPSIDLNAIAGITAAEKIIGKALQDYGAYCCDRAGARMAIAFELATDATDINNVGSVYEGLGIANDYFTFSKIPWNQLRVLKNWDGSA